MIKLYGFAASNYYNIVKHALLAKALPHEDIKCYPDQSDDFLSKSPLGKVPVIETEAGFLSETSVILEYLEETYPDQPLYPAAVFDRARARQVIKFAELYIDLPARRHLPEILLKTPRSEEAFQEAKPLMVKGLRALEQLSVCAPYLCGERLTHADIFVRYAFSVARMVATTIYDWDILEASEKLSTWSALMAQDPISKQVDEANKVAMAEFIAYIQSKYLKNQ